MTLGVAGWKREPMQVNEERQEGDAHDNGEISGGAYRMRAVR